MRRGDFEQALELVKVYSDLFIFDLNTEDHHTSPLIPSNTPGYSWVYNAYGDVEINDLQLNYYSETYLSANWWVKNNPETFIITPGPGFNANALESMNSRYGEQLSSGECNSFLTMHYGGYEGVGSNFNYSKRHISTSFCVTTQAILNFGGGGSPQVEGNCIRISFKSAYDKYGIN